MAETFSQFINRIVGIGNDSVSTIVLPQQTLQKGSEFYKLREPNQKEIDSLETFFNNSKFFTEKLNKVQEEYGLERLEAMGLALWISNEFSGMNALLYNEEIDYDNLDDEQSKNVAANYYANKALKSGKVQKYTQEGMVDLTTDVFLDDKLNPSNNLSRGINIYDSDKEKLINYYQENIGKEIVEKTFFATTAFSPEHIGFTNSPEILFEIKPKENGSGIMVDKGKNSTFEGEVIYPPGTKFKVNGMGTKVSPINRLLPTEKLDEIFESSPTNKIIQEYLPDKNKYKSLQLMSILALIKFDSDPNDAFTKNAVKYIKDRFPDLSIQQIQELLDLGANLTNIDEDNYNYIENRGGIQLKERFTIDLEEI